ncbi:MAG: AAA family ATPase [Candidatus Marinimicrobia bacterium]|nr:AAA family ATPase [Candidatus Neomarinimicrobiota bacterium]
MRFKNINLNSWQQFRDISIDFHPQLTILTGANASGKTTILNLLASHHDWNVPSLATTKRTRKDKAIQFLTRLFRGEDKSEQNTIGSLEYSNGKKTRLKVPASDSPSYQVAFDQQEPVPCFFVPSHRSVYRYQALANIPRSTKNKEDAFNLVWNSTKGRYFGGQDLPASFHMKETLIAWSVFGRGNEDMLAEPELVSYYNGFQKILKNVLPTSLGFEKFSIRNLEVVMECDSTEFMIDAASGGLSAIIDLAWQIFMYAAKDQSPFTVIIDEVENHLHPTMQRRILGDFIKAFPTVTFIVSTHSPLVVSSVKDSLVYVLRHDDLNDIRSEKLDLVNKARTANQILDEVLGVSSSIPIWAEAELMSIVREFENKRLNEEILRAVRERLQALGLQHFLPETIGHLIDENIGD